MLVLFVYTLFAVHTYSTFLYFSFGKDVPFQGFVGVLIESCNIVIYVRLAVSVYIVAQGAICYVLIKHSNVEV